MTNEGSGRMEWVDSALLLEYSEAFDSLASTLENKAATRRLKGTKKWASRASDPSTGILYKWMRPKAPMLSANVIKEHNGTNTGGQKFII